MSQIKNKEENLFLDTKFTAVVNIGFEKQKKKNKKKKKTTTMIQNKY